MANRNLIITAIRTRRVIKFRYKNINRIVEPFIAGVHKETGNDLLRGWVVSGTTSESPTKWRLYIIAEMTNLTILQDKFSGSRPGYDPKDDVMGRVYAKV